MTTEIAIMNKSAIALAADSAVTISIQGKDGSTCKVLNSANKLFALSKYEPIGLMVYGNASMLGIPWEIIIKEYREFLHDREFSYLQEYCDDFFSYLDQFDITNELQENYLVSGSLALFNSHRRELDQWVKDQINSKQNVSHGQVKSKLENIIKKCYNEFVMLAKQSVIPNTKRSNLRKKYRSTITKVAQEVFEKIPLSQQMESQLLTIAVNAASIGPINQSGIVIAGFGKQDLYPQCKSYDVAAVFAGKTIKRDKAHHPITHQMAAAIIPFAQSEDVHTFMEGIGPSLAKFLHTTFYGIMTESLPDRLCEEISSKLNLTDKQKAKTKKIAREMCKGACDVAFQKFSSQQRDNYIDPVMEATSFLNTAELAAMAETLVNLVSFRKQVTMEAETVGGPIDVAIITKGDGLIWIKRKHYFPFELNHHFFSKYYRKGNRNE